MSVVLLCSGAIPASAVTYWWRAGAPNGVWTNVNNWSTTGFFGGPAASFPGPADVATFGLLGETTAAVTFSMIPAAGVGAINAATLQRTLTVPAGETLNLVSTVTPSDAGGNALIEVLPGGTLRIGAGATVQGACGAHRWQIGGTLEIVDNGAVGSCCMGFYPGSVLRYTGNVNKTAGSEFIDGNTGAAYVGGFPGNVVVNKAVGIRVDMPSATTINGTTTLLAGNLRNNSAGSLIFNGSLVMFGANTRLVSGCSGGNILLNNTVNSMSGAGTEIWIGSGTLTVNAGAVLNITNGVLNIIGPGGCASAGQVNGGGTITYTSPGTLSTGGGWVGTLDTPELPISPTPMNGILDISGAGGAITVANDLRLIGDLNLGNNHLFMDVSRGIILEGGGVINSTLGRIKADNLNTVTIRRSGFNSILFLSNWVYRMVIDNPGSVNMTNPLTVGGGGLDFANAGNLLVGPTTLTLEGNGGNHVTGGAGRVDATTLGSVIQITGNPVVDGNRFFPPIRTLRTGATPAAAGTLNGPWMVNNLDHINGFLGISGAMTLLAGGTHTISAGPPLRQMSINSFGRLAIAPATTLTNSGTLVVGGAGTLDMQGNGYLAGNAPDFSTGSAAILQYSGFAAKGTGIEFPNTMPGTVVITNTAGVFQQVISTKTVGGQFIFANNGFYSLNGAGNSLVLNGPLINAPAPSHFEAFNDNLTINGTSTNPILFPISGSDRLANFTVNPSAGGVALGTNLTVSNNLSITNGNLFTGPNALSLSAGVAHSIGAGRTLQADVGGRVVIANGATLTNNGTLNVQGASTMEIQGNGIMAGASPTYAALNAMLHYTGTVAKNTMTVECPNPMPGSVLIQNTAQVMMPTAPPSIVQAISGTFTISNNGIFSLNGNNNSLVFNGAVNVLGGTSAFASSNNNSMTFNAAAPSTISFSVPWQLLNNLTMGAGSGNLTLNSPITNLSGALALNGGNIITTPANTITVTNTAIGSVTRTSGYIQGPLIRAMSPVGAYLFPSGNGGVYLPMTITNPGNVTASVTGFNTDPVAAAGTNFIAPFSTTEYWVTNVVAGGWGASPAVTLQRPANFAAGTTVGRRDAASAAGSYNAAGPLAFAGGTNIITSSPLVAPTAPMFFTTGTRLTATELRYLQQPTNVIVGGTMAPSVLVAATDAVGNIDNTFTGVVTVTSPNLVGSPVIVPLVNGIASFSSLQFTVPGTQALTAVGPLPFAPVGNSVSLNFTITPPTGWTCDVAPVAPASPRTFPNILDRSVTISNFQFIAGPGAAVAGVNTRIVPPGAALTVQFDYNVMALGTGCAGCVTQYYLGLPGSGASAVLGGAGQCFHSAVGGGSGANVMRTFTAPLTPGVYYISVGGSWEFSCNNNVGFGNNPTFAVGYIIVGNCVNSDIIADGTFTPNTAIPYVGLTAPAVTVSSPDVWRFIIRDGGTTAGADADPFTTQLTSLNVQVDDARGAIQNLALFVGATKVSADVTPTAGFANFTGLTINAADNATTTVLLKASYKTIPTTQPMDGAPLRFQITGATAAAAGSSFAAATVPWSGVSNVSVVASALSFSAVATSVAVGVPMAPAVTVSTVDAHGNRDIDWAGNVTLSSTYLAPFPTSVAIAGAVSFPALTFSMPASGQTLSATSMPVLTGSSSTAFSIIPTVLMIDSTTLNFGRVPIGSSVTRLVRLSATSPTDSVRLQPTAASPGISFSLNGVTFVSNLAIPPAAFSVSVPVYVRFTPAATDTLTRTGTLAVTHPFASSLAVPWQGVGINPYPRALGFSTNTTMGSSTATINLPGAWNSGVPSTVGVGAFRSDGALAGVPVATTIQLSAAAVGAGVALFRVTSSTATLAVGDSVVSMPNVRIEWLNGPAAGGSTTAIVTVSVVSGHTMIQRQVQIDITVDRTIPIITTINPSYQGGGGIVEITGDKFNGATRVFVGNAEATTFQLVSAQLIRAVVSTSATTGRVIVTSAGGSDTLRVGGVPDPQAFEFAPRPRLTSFRAVAPFSSSAFRAQAADGIVSLFGDYFRPKIKTGAPNPIFVDFGGTNAVEATATTDRDILARVGAGTSGKVTVRTIGGLDTAQGFIFVRPPIIHGVNPLFGKMRTIISVTGANFVAMSDSIPFAIGGAMLDSVRVLSDSLMIGVINQRASGAVQVANIAGSTVATQRFTFVDPPVIDSITPSSVVYFANPSKPTDTLSRRIAKTAQNRRLNIFGRNFFEVSRVMIGGVSAANITVISSTHVIALMGDGTSGTVSLRNAIADTTGRDSVDFVYAPRITSFAPAIGGEGVWVTVTGANFRADSTFVAFIGRTADSVVIESPTKLRARVANGVADEGSILVGNLAGQARSSRLFRYVPPPKIDSFTPTEGTTGATVTVIGSAFENVTNVTVGGATVANFSVETASRMVLTVGEGARGQIRIFTLQGSATSATIFNFVYKDTLPPPQITRFTPASGTAGDRITIRGVNFNQTRTVLIGGVTAATFTIKAPGELEAVLPLNATSGSITVITLSGSTSSTARFTFIPFFVNPANTPIGRDSVVLVRLYAANSGAIWKSIRGWLRTDSPEQFPDTLEAWTGVKVERVRGERRITELRLPNVGVQGGLPSFVTQLTELRVMDLRDNQLEGVIPSSMATLSRLQELTLSGNKFVNTPAGAMLDTLEKLRSLRILRLDRNGFTGELPNVICQLDTLAELNLAGNGFAGRIPTCWFGMKSLRILNLSNNAFAGTIQSEFSFMENLRELSLAGNKYEGSIPEVFRGSTSPTALSNTGLGNAGKSLNGAVAAMPALTRLDLSNNRFTGEIPQTLWSLSALQHLNLSGNKLMGTLSQNVRQLRDLRSLSLRNAGLSGALPVEINELSELQELSLDSNRFTGSIVNVSGLRRLETLGLSWNRFSSGTLSGLAAIKTLRLEGNALSFEPLEPFATRGLAFTYSPQDSIGTRVDTAALLGSVFRLPRSVGGAFNQYQWLKNGIPLDNQTTLTLGISSFSAVDSGVYVCRITNSRATALTLWSRPVTIALRLPGAPEAPTLVAPANNAQNVQLQSAFVWRKLLAATRYELEVSEDSLGNGRMTVAVTDTTARLTGLKNFARYYWRVRGLNEGGAGPWSALNTFVTIEASEVLPVTAVDFGRVTLKQDKPVRKTLQITNAAQTPITLVRVELREPTATSQFTIPADIENVALQPGQVYSVPVDFKPTSLGQKSATLRMTYTTQGGAPLTRERTNAVTGVGGALQVEVQGGNFGDVINGLRENRTLTIINRDASPVRLLGVKTRKNSPFRVEEFRPQTLQNEDRTTVTLSCFSAQDGAFEDVLEIEADFDRTDAPLTANVRQPVLRDIFYSLAVKPTPAIAEPGQPVTLGIYVVPDSSSLRLRNQDSVTQQRVDAMFRNLTRTGFQLSVTLNRQTLALSDAETRATYDRVSLSNALKDGLQIVKVNLRGAWSDKIALIDTIRCVAVNGIVDTSTINLVNFEWDTKGMDKMTPTPFANAAFTVGVCDAGGKRLVGETKTVKLTKAMPNPVTDETTIAYSVRESGFVTLALYDMKGAKLQTLVNKIHSPGEYTVTLRTTDVTGKLPSGAYMLVLETPSERLTERLEVVK